MLVIKIFFKLYVSGSLSLIDVNFVYYMFMFRGIVYGLECDVNIVCGDIEERVIKLYCIWIYVNVKY